MDVIRWLYSIGEERIYNIQLACTTNQAAILLHQLVLSENLVTTGGSLIHDCVLLIQGCVLLIGDCISSYLYH